MGDLIAPGPRVAPRIQPDRHAARERAWHAGPVSGGETGNERQHPAEHESGPRARHTVQRERHAPEHQRGAEVALREEEQEQDAEHHGERLNVAAARQLDETAHRVGRTM